MIEMSFQNGDFTGVVDTYVNILDYEDAQLSLNHIKMVLESLSF